VRRWTSGLIDHVRLTANNGDGLAGASELASAGEGDLAIGHEVRVGDAGVQGDFAEILVYDRAVVDDELADIMAYPPSTQRGRR
jgi:hypothetical protein